MGEQELKPARLYCYDDPDSTNNTGNTYSVHRLLQRGGSGFCSDAVQNVDVEFEFDQDYIFTAVEIGGVPGNYTAPIKDAVMFVSDTKLDTKKICTFNNLTREKYEEYEGKEKVEAKDDSSTKPVLFMTVPPYGESKFSVQKFARGRHVLIKFLRPYSANNIDVGHCFFFGRPAPDKLEIVGAANMKDTNSIQSVLQASKTESDLKTVEKVCKSFEELLMIDELKGWTNLKLRSGMKSGHIARIRRIVSKVRGYQIKKFLNSMDASQHLKFIKENKELQMFSVLDISKMDRCKIMELWRKVRAVP